MKKRSKKKQAKVLLEKGKAISVIGIRTSCGCANATFEPSTINEGETATLAIQAAADPNFTVHKKNIGVTLVLDDGCEVVFSMPFHVYSRLVVANEIDSGRSDKDAGELRIVPSNDRFVAPISLLLTEKSKTLLDKGNFVVVSQVTPQQFTASIDKTDNIITKTKLQDGETIYSRRIQCSLSGVFNQPKVTDVQINFVFFDGRKSTISLCLRPESELVASKGSLIFKQGDRSRKTFVVTRQDHKPFTFPKFTLADKRFEVTPKTTGWANAHSFEVALSGAPIQQGSFYRSDLVIGDAANYQPVTIPIICLSRN